MGKKIKYSPGPWTTDKGQIRDKDGFSLGSIPHTLGDKQDEANACLIAAAPEMYREGKSAHKLVGDVIRLLEEIINNEEDREGVALIRNLGSWLLRNDANIAKAEGIKK